MQIETLKSKIDRNHSKQINSEKTINAIEDVVQEKIVMIGIRTDTGRTINQETVTTTKTTADNTLHILDPRIITSEMAHGSQSFENQDRRYNSRSNDRIHQDYRNYSRERQYDRNDSRTRYRESNSPRQDYRRSNSSNQNSRDNSRERNSNRVQFRENKVNGFFVDNQQDEINLNQMSLRKKHFY